MERYNFYYQKYLACQKTSDNVKKFLDEEVEQIRTTLLQKMSFPLSETEFLRESCTVLISTKNVLKWSYVFGYSIKETKVKTRNLFEFY